MIRLGITASSLYARPDPNADAYIAAMTIPPSAERQELIQNLFRSLKTSGVWAKLDWLMLLASHTAQAALLNAKNPAKSALEVSGPDFTVDKGYSGKLTGSYLTTGENFNVSGSSFSLNSAFIYVYVNQENDTTTRYAIGTSSGNYSTISIAAPGVNSIWRINNITSYPYASAGKLGGHLVTRTTNTSVRYLNGVQVASSSSAAASIGTGNVLVLSGEGGYCIDRIGVAAYGSGLNATQAQAFNGIMTTYLTAIGAN